MQSLCVWKGLSSEESPQSPEEGLDRGIGRDDVDLSNDVPDVEFTEQRAYSGVMDLAAVVRQEYGLVVSHIDVNGSRTKADGIAGRKSRCG